MPPWWLAVSPHALLCCGEGVERTNIREELTRAAPSML